MLGYVSICSEDYKKWCEELGPSAVILFLFFIFVHNTEKKVSWHGQKSIEESTHLSTRTIKRSLKELELLGYIDVKRKKHSANVVKIIEAKLSPTQANMAPFVCQNGLPKNQKRTRENKEVNAYGFIQTN